MTEQVKPEAGADAPKVEPKETAKKGASKEKQAAPTEKVVNGKREVTLPNGMKVTYN